MDSFDTILTSADEIRSSNPHQFNKIIGQLNKQQIQLSLSQKHYLKYLNGYLATFSGKLDEAVTIYKEILSSNANKQIKFRANLSLVNTLAISKNWNGGMIALSKLIPSLQTVDDYKLYAMGVTVAAVIYYQFGQYERSVFYTQLLDINDLDKRTYCMVNMLSLRSKLKLNTLKDSTSEVDKGISICHIANEPVMANFIRSDLAHLYNKRNQPNQAIDLLSNHLLEVDSASYPRLSIEFYVNLSKAYLLQNKLKKAQYFALKVIKNSKGLETSEPVSQAYLSLFKIAEQNKDYIQALNYHKLYLATEKAFTDESSAKELAFQIAQHKSLEQQNQIKLLDKQNKLLTIERQLSKTELANNRLFMSLLSIIVVLLAFFGFRSYHTQKQLKALSEFDPLTGIYNRGHFTHLGKTALAYAKNTQQDLCLVMFDLDYFKSINDSYGHACGDWALKEVVKTIKTVIRQEDIFARIGGEEFCIILPNCDLPSSVIVVEQYRRVLTEINSIDSGQQYSISASFGITDVVNSGYQLEQLLADADTAMYKSKEQGRNRATIFNTF
ncbi:MAG: GGDEF domain-containing protein [Colwellia sp.]|nr:GGDEF domain-containing protein [Colwellia sp.]